MILAFPVAVIAALFLAVLTLAAETYPIHFEILWTHILAGRRDRCHRLYGKFSAEWHP